MTRQTKGTLQIFALATALFVGCGGDEPDWGQPKWGTAPLDTNGANIAPPPPSSNQPAPAQPYDPRDDRTPTPQEPIASATGPHVLRLDDVQVTTTGWAACAFYDWRMLGMLPVLPIAWLQTIPMFGPAVYQSVKWGKRFFALSDTPGCDIRLKATLGSEAADVEFRGPIALFPDLTQNDLVGQTLEIELLDCEICQGGEFELTTTIGVCSKVITGNDIDANGMQVDCRFEPMEWLEQTTEDLLSLPPDEERAFPTVSARLTFSFHE